MNGQITQVSLGNLTIDAVIDEACNYYVTVQSIASLFQIRQNNATRDLKALLGEQCSFVKITVKNDGANKAPNNCIALRDFELVVIRLARKDNPIAVTWVEALVGMSFTQLCADAFGVKFEAADRQAWLKARMEGKYIRRTLTDAIKDWGLRTGTDVSRHYPHCSDLINVAVCGGTAQQLRKARGLKAAEPLRDTHSARELKWIERLEEHAVPSIDRGLDPATAVKDAIAHYQSKL